MNWISTPVILQGTMLVMFVCLHVALKEVRAGARILGVGGLRKARVAFFTQDLAQETWEGS